MLTRRDVENIAHLARLKISGQEADAFAGSLSRILEFVEQLRAAETDEIQPMPHPLEDQVQRLREDVATGTDRHELYQRNAPLTDAGVYLVPKVIE